LWRDLMQSSDNLTAQISNLLTIELQSWFLMMSCRSHANSCTQIHNLLSWV
jgi:hypothetical protein